MIDYAQVKAGDQLKVVGAGAPGFAELGDTVTVVSSDGRQRCTVRRADGETAYFALTCGAARLEPLPAPPEEPETARGLKPLTDAEVGFPECP